jgi:hypothetical protein
MLTATCEANAKDAKPVKDLTPTTRDAFRAAKEMRQRTAFARNVTAAQSRMPTTRIARNHTSALTVRSVTKIYIQPGVAIHNRVQIAR